MEDQPLTDLAQGLLGKQLNDLEIEEHNVLTKITDHMLISRDSADVADERFTFGHQLADRVAAVGGSWGSIITFFVLLVGWMLLNTDILAHWNGAFDPYPFIFLNLMLSMLAAIQAPVIMMSQNRQAYKDRVAASLDYEVNLRAELDLVRLHEKINQLVAQRIDILIGKQDQLQARMNSATA